MPLSPRTAEDRLISAQSAVIAASMTGDAGLLAETRRVAKAALAEMDRVRRRSGFSRTVTPARFWGRVGDDAIAMFWHEGFGEFISQFNRMTMAPGYTIDGQPFKDHSPVIHRPTHWLDLPEPPVAEGG